MANSKKKRNNKRILFNAIGVLICAVAIPLLVMNLVLIIKGYTKPNEVPSIFNLCPIIETSDLMTSDSSKIKNGDLLIFHTKDFDNLSMGESNGAIVAIKADNNGVKVRRLISSEVNAEGVEVFTAIADNKDPNTQVEITKADIIGVYTLRFAGLGKFVLFSQTTVGLITVVVMPIAILFFIEIMLYYGNEPDKKQKGTLAPNPATATAAVKLKQATVMPNYVFDDVVEYDVYLNSDGKTVVKKVI